MFPAQLTEDVKQMAHDQYIRLAESHKSIEEFLKDPVEAQINTMIEDYSRFARIA